MDPVTSFSLAAGILQVVDVSFRALAQCWELCKDGSLAEHRETVEVTDALGRYILYTLRSLSLLFILNIILLHTCTVLYD